MLVNHTPKNHTYFADGGLSEVAHWIKTTPRKWRYEQSQNNKPERNWDLAVGLDGAQALATNGWTEGANNLDSSLRALPAPTNSHTKLEYNVAGHYPSVDRYLAGLPDNMVHKGKASAKEHIVHIVLNICANCAITSREMVNFGTAIAACVDKLESSGRRVELDVCFVQSFSKEACVFGWKVKRAREPLDLAALAFSVAHPAALRRIGFCMIERGPANLEADHYGYPGKLTEAQAAIFGADGALLLQGIGNANGACSTVRGALAYAAQSINTAAGETIVEMED